MGAFDYLDLHPTGDPGIVELDGVLYKLEITGEAEVIPGPISKVRTLCQQRIDDGQPLDPKTILTIFEEAGV